MSMNQSDAFNRGDVDQESQYSLPYHYIPSLQDGHFRQHLYWSWGYHYLGGMEVLFSCLIDRPFESLVDIGCGDGRFLREVDNRFPGKRLMGVDCSERAISLAKTMNPDLDYVCEDICSQEQSVESFDVVTLIEVLEHIPVENVSDFMSAVSRYVKPGGRILLTVPHRNKFLQTKHFQHFTSDSLRKILESHFRIEKFIYFDKLPHVFGRLVDNLLGNRFFILNHQALLRIIFSFYSKYLLYCDESRCGRIFVEGFIQ